MKNLIIIICTILFFSCSGEEFYIPKPKAFHRVEFNEHKYEKIKEIIPFEFEKATYSKLIIKNNIYYYIEYPKYNATIYLTYNKIKDSIAYYIEDVRKMAMKHIVKATDIQENIILDRKNKIYGIIYDFSGPTAVNMQFYVTDSIQHFLVGSLYFKAVPNPDSLQPYKTYIKEDVLHLIETFKWE